MRETAWSENRELGIRAIAGSHVVLLGINIREDVSPNLLGFAIAKMKTKPNEDNGKEDWHYLRTFKVFPGTEEILPGQSVSCENQPIQSFSWSDYECQPNNTYSYKIESLYGSPQALERKYSTKITISTNNGDGNHMAYFNRGVAGSQAYTRKFGDKLPDETPDKAAWKWLSRGLEEALLSFIHKANDSRYAIRACFYEFKYVPVMEALRDAARLKGVDVRIIHDAKSGSEAIKESRPLIEHLQMQDLMIERTDSPRAISHNKFIVLISDGIPKEVWTGSTNITQGGIFGQNNVGHVVKNDTIAAQYLNYWNFLKDDPTMDRIRQFNEENSSIPEGGIGAQVIFSPRSSEAVLEYYATLLEKENSSSFFTAAFGVNPLFQKIYSQPSQGLRYILLEKKGKEHDKIAAISQNRIAIGDKVWKTKGSINRWLKESLVPDLNDHVRYIHTKYLILNALSDNPTLITGSANFSRNSILNNDENMLIIHGDTDITDIYLTEFLRLFNHFQFRNSVSSSSLQQLADVPFLTTDDSWKIEYFDSKHYKYNERNLFGPPEFLPPKPPQ